MNKIIIKESYAKPWLGIEDQLAKLESRGLLIEDRERASRFLSYINYYRFAGYALPFQHWDPVSKDRLFNEGVKFEDVRFICEFDRDLRDVFYEGLELVEISLRASIAYKFAKEHGPFGHLKAENFVSSFSSPSLKSSRISYNDWHDKIVKETERSKETFVRHFQLRYNEFPDMPIWVVSEICSFGSLSEMLSNMLRCDQQAISAIYKLQHDEIVSWSHSLTYIRNICAHHSRLWDKTFRITPKLPSTNANWMRVKGLEKTVFVAALMLNWMLAHDSIDQQAHKQWKNKLEALMDRLLVAYPKQFAETGFDTNWKTNPLWWQY